MEKPYHLLGFQSCYRQPAYRFDYRQSKFDSLFLIGWRVHRECSSGVIPLPVNARGIADCGGLRQLTIGLSSKLASVGQRVCVLRYRTIMKPLSITFLGIDAE